MISVRPSALSALALPRDGAAPTPPVLASAPVASPAPVQSAQPAQPAQPAQQTVQSVFSSIWTAVSGFFSSVINWFKGLFSGSSSSSTPTSSLSPSDQALASQYGLLATSANVAAFKAEVSQYASNGTLGPGSTNSGAIGQLQAALSQLGYSVPVTGQFDQATAAAVTSFKASNGLHQNYQAADGSWAINEYATPDVVSAMLSALRQKVGA